MPDLWFGHAGHKQLLLLAVCAHRSLVLKTFCIYGTSHQCTGHSYVVDISVALDLFNILCVGDFVGYVEHRKTHVSSNSQFQADTVMGLDLENGPWQS